MNTRNDQGLGAIGLIILTVVLSLLLTVWLPIRVSKDSVELKDWLGFAGNVLGAIVTLGAAALAWKAVQSQIDAQRSETLLGILTREEDKIENALKEVSNELAFVSSVRQTILNYPYSPRGCLNALRDLGLSPSYDPMVQFLRRDVGFDLKTAESVGFSLAHLVKYYGFAAEAYDRCPRNEDGNVRYTQEYRDALEDVATVEKPVDSHFERLNNRVVELSNIGFEYRKRINREFQKQGLPFDEFI